MKLWELLSLYLQWQKRHSGKPIIDLTRTTGYFFPVGLLGYSPKTSPHYIKMQSGKVMIAKLLDYELYRDPNDMIKWAQFQYLGYENEKPFAELTWAEYKEAHYGAA